MVSSLTRMLKKKIKHAKFNLKFHWGLGYNLQNSLTPFREEETSQVISNKGVDQWNQ